MIRLLIVGESSVGKTSLLIRFNEGEVIDRLLSLYRRYLYPYFHPSINLLLHPSIHSGNFYTNQRTTIGVDYKAKEIDIDGETIKLQVM
jgi:GTPase SAR1 family protein